MLLTELDTSHSKPPMLNFVAIVDTEVCNHEHLKNLFKLGTHKQQWTWQ